MNKQSNFRSLSSSRHSRFPVPQQARPNAAPAPAPSKTKEPKLDLTQKLNRQRKALEKIKARVWQEQQKVDNHWLFSTYSKREQEVKTRYYEQELKITAGLMDQYKMQLKDKQMAYRESRHDVETMEEYVSRKSSWWSWLFFWL